MSSRKLVRPPRSAVLESRLVWPVAAQLGEGPLWQAEAARLWFVDIERGSLHWFDPGPREHGSIHVGGEPSFVVPASDGSLLLGMGDVIRPFRDGRLGDAVVRIDMPAHNRANDATVDAAGRLWFGTMDRAAVRGTGAVHVFDRGMLSEAGGRCIITNGPAASGDGGLLYHVDTLGGTIWRFEIDGRDRLDDGEVFATIDPADGVPDGVTIDAEHCLWVALWGGWAVRRYAPDGRLLMSVALPCAQVTKLAFGGADLRTAYVTTARTGLSADEIVRQPLAGGLFAFEAPAPGLLSPKVALA